MDQKQPSPKQVFDMQYPKPPEGSPLNCIHCNSGDTRPYGGSYFLYICNVCGKFTCLNTSKKKAV